MASKKTKTQKRNERKRALSQLDTVDLQACSSGSAINTMHAIGPVQSCRLNFTYKCDGFTFNTGKKHRKIG